MAGKPKMCAECGKLMGTGDECPYCGADNRKISLRLKRAAASSAKTNKTPATIFFIGVNVFLFIVMAAVGSLSFDGGFLGFGSPDQATSFRFGLMFQPAITAGDWWRISMPIFLHLSIVHLGFNCFVAWTVGRKVEEEFGTPLMVLIYLMSGIVGFVGAYYINTNPSAGASGAISGLVGCILIRRWLIDGNFRSPIAMWALQMVVLTAILGFVLPGIDNVSHLGGFLTGVGFAFLLTKVRLGRAGTILLLLTNAGVVLLCVGGAVVMVLQLGNTSPESVIKAQVCVRTAMGAVPADANVVDDRQVAEAEKCFSNLDIAGADETTLERIKANLVRARKGEEEGNTAMVQGAGQEIQRDGRAWTKWLERNMGRFGLFTR
ncbi:MAG: rhomboid protease GluP [Myxococcota bacterium]|jgi:rhomboid protease GluP